MNNLIEYKPSEELRRYIDSFWFFRNTQNEQVDFPVVPDGCSDIIFYLNNSKKLEGIDDTFVTGVMESAQLIPILKNMESFGIRFKPGVLSYLLEVDMSTLADNMVELSELNRDIYKKIKVDKFADDLEIIKSAEEQLNQLCSKSFFEDNFLKIVEALVNNPNEIIEEVAKMHSWSIKKIERVFHKRIGITPKKFARIMRFQSAHKKISREGITNLIKIAMTTGYFDQAHFNREYKKMVGYNPSSETMSILYNEK